MNSPARAPRRRRLATGRPRGVRVLAAGRRERRQVLVPVLALRRVAGRLAAASAEQLFREALPAARWQVRESPKERSRVGVRE